MILNLINLLGNDGAVLPFEAEIENDLVKFQGGEYSFTKPISVRGKIENLGGEIEIEAEIDGSLKTSCARCMEDAVYNFKTFVSERVDLKNAENDLVELEGSTLNLKPVIINTILMDLPIRILCSEDCKGLCPICGKNLNRVQCSCDDREEDPRFAVLKNIILKDEV